tara:strand:+ start:458 stop:673 length:216 start_codon:yes stop_codon:yes gene_type:complete
MQDKGFQGGQIQQVRQEEDKVVPLRPDLRGEIQGSNRLKVVVLHNNHQFALDPRLIFIVLSAEQDQPTAEG